VNKVLYILTVVAILHFQTSHKLSFAYGLSVAGVMLITTILFSILLLSRKTSNTLKFVMISGMLFLDSTFVLTSITKIFEGAWYALLITSVVVYYVIKKGPYNIK
jgi:KUP system potassium uptake protein